LKYLIEIGNSEEYILVTPKCHSYLEGGLKDLQPVTLHFGIVQGCLGEHGEFSCEIEIVDKAREETFGGVAGNFRCVRKTAKSDY
jgi:hypothetical protein